MPPPKSTRKRKAAPAPLWSESCRPELLHFLNRSPDCDLIFNKKSDAGAVLEVIRVPMHRQALKAQSNVLLEVLEQPTAAPPPFEHAEMAGWLEALHYMFPIRPQQTLTWARVAVMLPVLHKYDVRTLLDECCAWVAGKEEMMSATKDDDNYVLRWLEFGEQLQLDRIKEASMHAIALLLQQGQTGMMKDAERLSKLQVSTLVSVLGLTAADADDDDDNEDEDDDYADDE